MNLSLSNRFVRLLLRYQTGQKSHLFLEDSDLYILNLVFPKTVVNKALIDLVEAFQYFKYIIQ
jgi:hypothetical protein